MNLISRDKAKSARYVVNTTTKVLFIAAPEMFSEASNTHMHTVEDVMFFDRLEDAQSYIAGDGGGSDAAQPSVVHHAESAATSPAPVKPRKPRAPKAKAVVAEHASV